MTTKTLMMVAVLVLMAAGAAAAQSPIPGGVKVGEGWVPCSHRIAIEAGLGCTATTPAPAPADTGDDCRDLNPYADPDRVIRCSNRPPKPMAVPLFLVGHVYGYGYKELQARVIGVTIDPEDGVQVITIRWRQDDSDGQPRVEARRTPATPGGDTVWVYVGR